MPDSLRQPLFSVQEGLGAGATPRQLRNRRLERTVWGVRGAQPARDLEERCALFAARLGPSAFFCHRTAAALHDIPLPPSRSELIDVALAWPERAPHAQGLRGHSLAVASTELAPLGRVRVTTVVRTWFDLGKILAIPDLVAAGDRIIAARTPLATPTDLQAMVDAHPGERGVRKLAAALPLLSDRSESPQESRLRALLAAAGLAAPSVNQEIRDRHGAFLARGDLVWERERLVLEYQGDYHRDREQWRRDMTRRGRLEAAGWRVLEVNADDLADPAVLTARVATLLRH
jgi:very-short-patch-repair endonuclease